AADAVFPAGGGLLPALRQGHRHRYAGVADAALFGGVPAGVVDLSDRLLDARPAAGPGYQLCLPAAWLRPRNFQISSTKGQTSSNDRNSNVRNGRGARSQGSSRLPSPAYYWRLSQPAGSIGRP